MGRDARTANFTSPWHVKGQGKAKNCQNVQMAGEINYTHNQADESHCQCAPVLLLAWDS